MEGLASDRIARWISGDAPTGSDPAPMTDSMRKAIRRIEVADRRVTLHVDLSASGVTLETLQHRLPVGDVITETGGRFTIAIQIRLKTWGGETVIKGPNGTAANAALHLDQNFINAIARAHEWRDVLISGKAKSFRAIARGAGFTEGYVRQIVELAFVAPEITASILRGTQARHLTVDRLVRQSIPLSWREQRRVFGLAG